MTKCLCQCGEETAKGKNYKPGHDARHVSQLMQGLKDAAKDEGQKQIKLADARHAAKVLPSENLVLKFMAAVERFNNKPSKDRFVWVLSDTDVYRVGRWDYPVQVKMLKAHVEGEVDNPEYFDFKRNEKRDGSGKWLPLQGGQLVGL